MNKPLVSIVTPSFNQAAYLEQTILSVLNQDYPEIEYIIIDGNSTDNSVNIIRRYADHIAYWVSEPDKGQSHAINKGFARARGEIVAWLNSDDLYLPRAVSDAVDSLECNPRVGMVYSNCLKINKESKITGWCKSRQFDLLDLLSFNIIPQPTVFLRRDTVTTVGGLDTSLHLPFDHQMWVRVVASVPILYQDRYWAAARLHPASKNATRWADFGKEATVLLKGLATNPEISSLLAAHENRILAGLACFTGNYLMVSGDVRAATHEFVRALRLQPGIFRRSWLQLGVLVLMWLKLVRPGRSFESLRRWRRFFMSKPDFPREYIKYSPSEIVKVKK